MEFLITRQDIVNGLNFGTAGTVDGLNFGIPSASSFSMFQPQKLEPIPNPIIFVGNHLELGLNHTDVVVGIIYPDAVEKQDDGNWYFTINNCHKITNSNVLSFLNGSNKPTTQKYEIDLLLTFGITNASRTFKYNGSWYYIT